MFFGKFCRFLSTSPRHAPQRTMVFFLSGHPMVHLPSIWPSRVLGERSLSVMLRPSAGKQGLPRQHLSDVRASNLSKLLKKKNCRRLSKNQKDRSFFLVSCSLFGLHFAFYRQQWKTFFSDHLAQYVPQFLHNFERSLVWSKSWKFPKKS